MNLERVYFNLINEKQHPVYFKILDLYVHNSRMWTI